MMPQTNKAAGDRLAKRVAISLLAVAVILSSFMAPYAVAGGSLILRLLIGITGTIIFSAVGWALTTIIQELPRGFAAALFGASVMVTGFTYYALSAFPGLEFGARLPLSVLVGLLICAVVLLFTVVTGTVIASKRRLAAGLAVLTVAALVCGFVWLTYPTRDNSVTMNKVKRPNFIRSLNQLNSATRGAFLVRTFSYGSGRDVHRPEYGSLVTYKTAPVDASSFLQGWTDRRTAYWGFDQTRLPLNGLAWFPSGAGPFPLVLIVHGIHEMTARSDAGFAYLGELMASRGYIVASIDENFFNCDGYDRGGFLEDAIDARAWLILQHLKQWKQWAENTQSPFFRKVDMDRIALIGHSRGGEAIALAALFNRLHRYPGDANVEFNFHFHIRSLVALSPTDYYQPENERIPVQDVNFLVLHGANDNDLSSFLGNRIYKRVVFTDAASSTSDAAIKASAKRQYFFKASLLIGRANHSQFNSMWGVYDKPWPSRMLENTKDLISGEDQRLIAKVYVSAFLDATLRGERGYLPLFRDHRLIAEWLPDTTYANQFEDSTFHVVSNFDEDVDSGTTTVEGGRIIGRHLTYWHEQDVSQRYVQENGWRENNAVYLGWGTKSGAAPFYMFVLPSGKTAEWRLTPKDMLSFSLAYPASLAAPDFSIMLIATDGQTARIPLSRLYDPQPMLKSRLTTLTLFEKPSSQITFQTISIPLSTFIAVNREFIPRNLQKIVFYFDRSPHGALLLDDLGFLAGTGPH